MQDDLIQGFIAGLLAGFLATLVAAGVLSDRKNAKHREILVKNNLIEAKADINGKLVYTYTTNFVKP